VADPSYFPCLEDAMTASRRLWSSLPVLATLGLLATSPAAAQGVEYPRVSLRTAINELTTVRATYADLYNKKDAAALTAMYLPDAVLILADGSTVMGQAAIGRALGEQAASWKPITLSSDTTRVFGNTAWDVGSMSSGGAVGEGGVNRYLVVLRRGLEGWKISSVAVVPETRVAATR
jgi:ketosteroid isomerase-like protein